MFSRRTFLTGALSQLIPARSRPNILVCISDDQSYPHAGACGSPFFVTPGFDRVAREGVLFRHAFVSAPSCAPSRAALLTGQDFYRLREASMNHAAWPKDLVPYTDLLEAAGYFVGYTGKGWGPGDWRASGRKHNPCGPEFNHVHLEPPARFLSDIDYAGNFERFLEHKPSGAPFCFWVGFQEPHRPFEWGCGPKHGKRIEEVPLPGFLPDLKEVRIDLADYAYEIEYCDRHLVRILEVLEKRKLLEDTLIVVTSDNGMAFPRAKATLYDYGTRVPLAIRWGRYVRPGRVVDDFVSLVDLAPTFLEAAGAPQPAGMTGRSLLPVLASTMIGQVDASRDFAVFGLERHFPASRPEGRGYPCRGIRTANYLYILSLAPERSPAGDHPGPVWPADDPVGGFGDVDGSPTKTCLWRYRERYKDLFEAAFGKRDAEELYNVRTDPYNLNNLAREGRMAPLCKAMRKRLEDYLIRTGDPRATGHGEQLDEIMRRFPSNSGS